MKKTLCFFAVLLVSAMAIGQSIVVTFTGRNQNGNYHPFTSVSVQNQTRGWSQTLTYPDTTLILNITQGIADIDRQMVGLSAVAPNPFVGTATATLALAEAEHVTFEVVRINGQRIVAKDLDLPAGSHQIALSLAETQVAFLVVKTPTQRYVAKLANKSNGGGNDIRIIGPTEHHPQYKAVAEGTFHEGDLMVYLGMSNDGTSAAVAKAQQANELITLVFTEDAPTVYLPTVSTVSASDITTNSATSGGNVTDDGNATVTARGVCWSTAHNPTVSGSHTTDGSGTGSFTSSITGLSQNTTYYVRAYATNSVGTAYGNEVSFTTNTPSVGGFDENGTSNAVFTVASGRTVHFSRGNLQYQASTCTWRFAEHQYDTVGVGNWWNIIFSSYSGWIDLFGWGTSGWNSGAVCYQPWDTSSLSSRYRPGGSSYTNSLTGEYANADWGVYNAISNGGNQGGMWRTLTKDEWDYLLNSRAASTINGEANARYAKAVVNGTNGVVLFPDNFTMPSGMSYPLGINTSSAPFNNNTYTESQWSQMEGSGCIFLPAAGYRYGEAVEGVGTNGGYWSSTYGTYYADGYTSGYTAYNMGFYDDNIYVGYDYRYFGLSVRLVRDSTSANMSLPTVTTSSVSSITSSTATCGGNVTNSGNATVTARGVCWSTSHNPTVSNSHTIDGSGTGSFTSIITWLSQNTTYYVRAYATNSFGTAYGEERTFTTNTPGVGGFDENGASNAVFTVDEGRTVRFSRGNLQYQASTGIWRFAEHQWDFVGDDNSNISSSYSGWIDLFGWGTSGWNSGANAYQPWSTSQTRSDYYPGGNYAINLYGSYANADWGVYNAISNGGNQAGMWRTFTYNEWEYLLNFRSASTINGVANARYAKAVVNGINGLVIFPDNFTMPSGISYPSGINTNNAPFNNNTYTDSQWSQMEGAGCIFLPTSCLRRGTDMYDVGTWGHYWSSSCGSGYGACEMYFYSGDVNMSSSNRYDGHSVRLVRDY